MQFYTINTDFKVVHVLYISKNFNPAKVNCIINYMGYRENNRKYYQKNLDENSKIFVTVIVK